MEKDGRRETDPVELALRRAAARACQTETGGLGTTGARRGRGADTRLSRRGTELNGGIQRGGIARWPDLGQRRTLAASTSGSRSCSGEVQREREIMRGRLKGTRESSRGSREGEVQAGRGVDCCRCWGFSGAMSRGALLRSRQRRSEEVPAGLDGTRGGGGWPDAENEGGREAGCGLGSR